MSKKEVDGPESPREKPCIHEIRFGLLAAGRIGKDCQETCAIDICHFEKKGRKRKRRRKSMKHAYVVAAVAKFSCTVNCVLTEENGAVS